MHNCSVIISIIKQAYNCTTEGQCVNLIKQLLTCETQRSTQYSILYY